MKISKQRFSLETLNFFIDILMIILGIIGTAGGLAYSLYFPQQGMYGVYILIITMIMFYISRYYKITFLKQSLMIVFGIAATILFLYFIELELLFEQLGTVIEHDYFLKFDELFMNIQNGEVFLPIAFIVVTMMPVAYLVVNVVTNHKQKLLPFFLLIIIFVFPSFIRHQLESYTSYCFILFITYEYIFSYALYKQENPIQLKIIILPILCLFLFLSSLFLEPNPIFNQGTSTVLNNITSWINTDTLEQIINGSNVTGTSASVSGSLPTSDISLSNSIALNVEASEPFSSYIRGYSLASYSHNTWHPVKKDFQKYSNSLSYINNHFSSLGISTTKQYVKVTSTKKTSYQFVPYFPDVSLPLVQDSYYEPIDRGISIFQVYPLISHSMYNINPKYQRGTYDDYVRDEYLDIPSDLEPMLIKFLLTYQDGVDLFNDSTLSAPYKADLIQKMLTSYATYDLKTGDLPNGKDFVEYFMVESKKGSCTHFSTSLALLLRCVGIPTRFTRGYILKSTDFKDGKASVRSHRSHAWVEAYFDGYGWIPYEATPVAGSSATPSEVGGMLDEYLNRQDNPTETPQQQQNNPTTNTPNENPTPTVNEDTTNWYDAIVKYSSYIIGVLGAVILLILYRYISKRIFYVKVNKLITNQKVIAYYQRMKLILRFGGTIDERIVDIAKKAKFSSHKLTQEEVSIVEDYYLVFIMNIYKKLPWYKKIVYKYIFGYM